MKENTNISEATLDLAAAEALGANSPADSAAYQRDLAANARARQLDSELKDTVAAMAAASPYMQPPADLRGKILQATAPMTFKMEDYRKATRDNLRFYRWGAAAAVLFLSLGAWYNITLQNNLRHSIAQQQAMVQQINAQNEAISKVASPNSEMVRLVQDNRVFGHAYVDESNKTAVVVLPSTLLPPGKTIGDLTLTNSEGKPVAYHTIVIPTPREAFPQVAATDKLNPELKAGNPEPANHTIRNATMVP